MVMKLMATTVLGLESSQSFNYLKLSSNLFLLLFSNQFFVFVVVLIVVVVDATIAVVVVVVFAGVGEFSILQEFQLSRASNLGPQPTIPSVKKSSNSISS